MPNLQILCLCDLHGCSVWRRVHSFESKAVFTQRSLSDLTLDQSKVMSDKVCVNTLNRIGKPGR